MLLTRIPKKFKFLTEMNDDEWTLSLDGAIVDKSDSALFGETISKIPPVPTIDVVKVEVLCTLSLSEIIDIVRS